MAMTAPGRPASLERLRATARDLVSLTSGGVADRLHRAPAPGEWSPLQVLAHLADAELVYSVRFRLILTSARAELTEYDQEAWVQRFADLDGGPRGSLARWRPLRDANLALLESLEDEEWDLTGRHPGRGETTVRQTCVLLAAHDREHLDQLRGALARLG